MSKKHQQYIQSSVDDLLQLLEHNSDIENMIGSFRLSAVLGFLIEMTEIYSVAEDHKRRLLEAQATLDQTPASMILTDLN